MTTYRDSVAKIRAMKKELNTNYMIMSQYERQRIEGAIENEISRSRPLIVQGALTDWHAAIGAHKNAAAAVDAARRKEAQRWDLQRLSGELQLARLAFDRSQTVQEAQAEYQRALDSSDAVKIRAFAEVFSGASNKFREDRLPAHRLAVEASRKAEAMQTTPEIIAALEKGSEATKRIVDLQTEIGSIAQEIGVSGDMYRELGRAHVHTQYNEDRGGWETSIEITEPAEAVTV